MDKDEIVLIVCLTSVLLVLLLSFLLFMLLWQRRKSNRYINERETMKTLFNEQLLISGLEIREQTLQTIGADLHDNIGQLLSLTSLTLNSVEFDDIPKAQQKINAAIELTLRSIKEMRQLGKLLQGEQLIAMGLIEALRHEIMWIEKAGTHQVNYEVPGETGGQNNADKDLILFRISQEILNNIIKHAAATCITIKLEYKQELLYLQIADNGAGFDPTEVPADQKGMGLQNIQKRAEVIGGEAHIVSEPGKGTHIEIIIPYP